MVMDLQLAQGVVLQWAFVHLSKNWMMVVIMDID